MAKPLARSIEDAISLGFKRSTLSIDEIHKLIDEQRKANADSQAFRKDCLTLQEGEQCLQTDCGLDGREFVGFCKGSACVTLDRPCAR